MVDANMRPADQKYHSPVHLRIRWASDGCHLPGRQASMWISDAPYCWCVETMQGFRFSVASTKRAAWIQTEMHGLAEVCVEYL